MRALCESTGAPVTDAIDHHLAAGGGRTRGRTALSTGLALGLSETVSLAIAAGCELLHNASLLHDDIQDRDTLRRGRPAAWTIFGEASALLAGDAMISAAYAALAEAPRTGVLIAHAHRRVAETIAGQARDLDAGGRALSLQAYEAAASAKSGPLFALALELPLLAAGCEADTRRAGEAAHRFALAYQMNDDLADAHADRKAGALNAVIALEAAGDIGARARVERRIAQHLDAARALAASLPRAAGEPLRALIATLAAPACEPA
ncbi:MAG: polyprenyl synthetase family protein [Oceanicaulis sp.]